MADIKLCDEAIKVLKDSGFDVAIDIHYGSDRRDFSPDTVTYIVSKDGEVVYRTSFRSEEKEPKYRGKDFGSEVLADCLELEKNAKYQEAARTFKRELAELLELQKSHNPLKMNQKRTQKALVEKLCHYSESRGAAVDAYDIAVTVPLYEDNKEVIAKVLEELKALELAEKAKDSAGSEAGGPQM